MKKGFVLRKTLVGAAVMVLLSLSLAGCSGKSTEAPAETAAAEENKEEKQAEPAPTDESEKKQDETPAENAVAELEEKQENSGGAANGNIDVDALTKDAEAGDAEAQFELGYLYYYGVKVEKDYAKAAICFLATTLLVLTVVVKE